MSTVGERGPWRRAMFLALLLALLCAWAWSLSTRVWYVFQSQEAHEAAAATFRRSGGFTDLTYLSAWDLVLPGTGGNPVRETAALSDVGGVPLPLLLVLAAGALGVFGVLFRSAILPVVGVLVANFARSLVSALRVNLEETAFVGPYMSPTPAVGEFTFVCWAVMGVVLVISIQVAYANYRSRKLSNTTSPSLFDSMWAIQTAGLGRLNPQGAADSGVRSAGPQ